MAAMTSIVLKEVKDITECPICTEMFSNPKMLPCFHTFCLKCTEQYCKDKKEGDTMPCPMCRKEFIVPIGGLSKLSVNFFVERLITAQSPSMNHLSSTMINKVANCEVCLAGKQSKVEATYFCVECEENMCDPCSTMHKSMKMSMNHHISTIGDPSAMEHIKNKIRRAFCDKHPKEEINFFCRDCKIPFCTKCFIAKHNKHECCEIEIIAEEYKKGLLQHTDDVNALLTINKNLSDEVDEQLASFSIRINTAEKNILARSEEIKLMVDKQTQALLEKLGSHKTHCLKNLHTTKEELQRNMMVYQNFVCYCQKAIEEADAVESIRIGKELKTRAEELKEKPMPKLNKLPDIQFHLSDLDVASHLQNIFGNIHMKHSLESNPVRFEISNDKLFCTYPGSRGIRVYDIDSFAFQRTIAVDGMKDSWDIMASMDALYVSTFEDKLIHRIQLPEETVSNWSVEGTRLKLSISKNGNVIVASWDPEKIFEYTSDGTFVRVILVDQIDKNLIGLKHAIQLEEDKFLVCHASTTWSRICIIDTTGKVIKCYGGNQGSGMGHLNVPVHLAIDRNGSILVADMKNNRVVQLNASLEYVNEFAGFKEPIRLRVNGVRKQLYITGIGDSSITFLDTFNISK